LFEIADLDNKQGGAPNKMLKASNLKAPGFSLGFGFRNLLRAESTPES